MSQISSINIPNGYRSQSEDTSIEIDFFLFQKWRTMSLIKKSQLIIGATQGCRKLSLMGIQNQYPNINQKQKRYFYVQRILGEEWAKIINNWNIEQEIMIGNPIELALLIATILENLEILYFIGGSVASSLWGESRATLAVDLVADLKRNQVNNFIEQVKPLFYISENSIIIVIPFGL